MRIGTRLIQAVFGEPEAGQPFLRGPTFASTYPHAGDPTGAAFTYGRTSNPTWSAYEHALAELEGGPCLVFASGMAAVSALLCSVLRPGNVVVLSAGGYYGTRAFTGFYLGALGVGVRLLGIGEDPVPVLEGASLVVIESPSNPELDVYDVETLARLAHDAGALVAVDNSSATVLGQQPLALGADYTVNSDTKALTGHSDLLLGHVAVADPDRLASLLEWRTQTGAVPGPMETWLAHRSLATLEVRLRRQCASALAIAEELVRRPAVRACRYPGLPRDPSYELASRQMAMFGPILNFTLDSQDAAEEWLERARLVIPATSFGGVHTTAERRARWAGDAVPPGFVRLSVGLEDPDDLVADIVRAIPT